LIKSSNLEVNKTSPKKINSDMQG